MRIKKLLFILASAGMVIGSGVAVSQQQHPHEDAAKGAQGRGMMGGGGMMNMMQQCERMMAARGGHAMPQLPPGNEKLQLQMHAEIMQKVGEILSKYAAQVK